MGAAAVRRARRQGAAAISSSAPPRPRQVPGALRTALGRRGGQRGVSGAALGSAGGVVGGRAQQQVAELDLALVDVDQARRLGIGQLLRHRQPRLAERSLDHLDPPGVGGSSATSNARQQSSSERVQHLRRKPALDEMPGRSGSSSGSRPARCPSESRRGISSSASGLPPAPVTSRSATDGASRSAFSSSRASSSASGDTVIRSRATAPPCAPRRCRRAGPSIATPSAPSRRRPRTGTPPATARRAAGRRVDRDRTGCSSAATASRLSRPAGTVKRSCGVAGPSASAQRPGWTSRMSSSARAAASPARRGRRRGMSDSVSIPARPQDAHAGRLADRPPHQRGLADPGVAVQQQRAAPSGARILQQPVDPCPLARSRPTNIGAVYGRLTHRQRPSARAATDRCKHSALGQPQRAVHPRAGGRGRDLARGHVAVALGETRPVGPSTRGTCAYTSAGRPSASAR